MKKKTYSFRSVRAENVEKPILGSGYSRMVVEFDMENVQKHDLELGLLDIMTDRTWKMGLFLSFMVVSAVFALIYGLLRAGLGMDISSSGGLCGRTLFFLLALFSLVSVWIVFSFRFAITNKKKEAVEKARGKGSWKIIDEADWERFHRMWKLARENEEKEREDFKKKLNSRNR